MKRLGILVIALSVLLMAMFAGCVGTKEDTHTSSGDVHIEGDTGDTGDTGVSTDWCSAGTAITVTGPEGGTYTIKGMTTYKGQKVCKAVMDTENIRMIQYFDKNKKAVTLILKDKTTGEMHEVHINN